jgi:hypothetical protein
LKAALAIARDFQNFAVAGGHIGANEIWGVPAAFELPKREPVKHQLHELMIEALKTYRAPQ